MIALRRNRIGRDWTAADFDSVEVLIAAGVRRPAARVTQARSPRPVRRAMRAVLRSVRFHTGLHRTQQEPGNFAGPVDWDAARRAAEAVNRGDVDEADRIVDATADPRHTAFAAFRFIDVD
ncbi:hypothetical protein [Streptomyces marianii]|uniref:Uncharacterized protein n=1 Tax=Streptomyces marianii TaxID=1817406 RepID=A0A5R9DUR8_9ACTN|nr:hypothetical protein [Streptomyces marianii]TLQ38751.1 hypothetical protein FEF34_40660 [Streptomyces marianii]